MIRTFLSDALLRLSGLSWLILTLLILLILILGGDGGGAAASLRAVFLFLLKLLVGDGIG